MSSLNPVFTVGFQLTEVLTKHLGMTGRQSRARALELLRDVGIQTPRRRSTPIRSSSRVASSSA